MTESVIPLSIAGTQMRVTPEFRTALFQSEQGGNDEVWQRNRHPFLTSTVTGSVLNPRDTERTWFERMKLAAREENDDLSLARMKRGSVLEPVARMCFEKMMNVRVYERGLWISKERPHTAVSPDGFVLEGDNRHWNHSGTDVVCDPSEIPTNVLVEIKCPSSAPKEESNGTFIRDTYLVQVMDAMDKLNCESCYFVILETEDGMEPIRQLITLPGGPMPYPGKLHVFLVHRSQFFIDAMRLAVDYFTSCLEKQVQPAPEFPFSEKEYAKLFKKIKVDTIMRKDIPENVYRQITREAQTHGKSDDMEIETQ